MEEQEAKDGYSVVVSNFCFYKMDAVAGEGRKRSGIYKRDFEDLEKVCLWGGGLRRMKQITRSRRMSV